MKIEIKSRQQPNEYSYMRAVKIVKDAVEKITADCKDIYGQPVYFEIKIKDE